jgi:hypothetical protein
VDGGNLGSDQATLNAAARMRPMQQVIGPPFPLPAVVGFFDGDDRLVGNRIDELMANGIGGSFPLVTEKCEHGWLIDQGDSKTASDCAKNRGGGTRRAFMANKMPNDNASGPVNTASRIALMIAKLPEGLLWEEEESAGSLAVSSPRATESCPFSGYYSVSHPL